MKSFLVVNKPVGTMLQTIFAITSGSKIAAKKFCNPWLVLTIGLRESSWLDYSKDTGLTFNFALDSHLIFLAQKLMGIHDLFFVHFR